MINLVFLCVFLGVTEMVYRVQRWRWQVRKSRLEPVTTGNVWLVVLGLVEVEYPPARAPLYVFAVIGWILFVLVR